MQSIKNTFSFCPKNMQNCNHKHHTRAVCRLHAFFRSTCARTLHMCKCWYTCAHEHSWQQLTVHLFTPSSTGLVPNIITYLVIYIHTQQGWVVLSNCLRFLAKRCIQLSKKAGLELKILQLRDNYNTRYTGNN